MIYVVVEELIPEMSAGEALEYRYHFLCGWILADDAPGCGTGVRMAD